jgi:hypothetical protein
MQSQSRVDGLKNHTTGHWADIKITQFAIVSREAAGEPREQQRDERPEREMPPNESVAAGPIVMTNADSNLDTCCSSLTDEDLVFAKEFLNEDAESRKTQLESLRSFLQTNSYLNARTGQN